MIRSITSLLFDQSVCCLRLYSSSIKIPQHLIAVVPTDSIKKSFTCSGGPGGQHVNKVATKAEIRFPVTSSWIPTELQSIITEKYAYRVSKDGEVVIVSSKTRSQTQNLEDCFEKLDAMLKTCAVDVVLRSRKTPNQEETAILEQRRERAAHFRRLEKARHSLKKRLRSQVDD